MPSFIRSHIWGLVLLPCNSCYQHESKTLYQSDRLAAIKVECARVPSCFATDPAPSPLACFCRWYPEQGHLSGSCFLKQTLSSHLSAVQSGNNTPEAALGGIRYSHWNGGNCSCISASLPKPPCQFCSSCTLSHQGVGGLLLIIMSFLSRTQLSSTCRKSSFV